MRIVSILVWLLVTAATAAEKGTITPTEMRSWKIVCDPAATESEHYAATEFQRLFKEMTGAVLPVVETAAPGSGVVCIGRDAAARRAPPVSEREWSGEEGFLLQVRRGSVCIDGARPRGTLYGVYEFFVELCGVRFLTFDHTYYPERAMARKIKCGSYGLTKPTFAFRWSYYGENHRHPEFATRLRVNTITDDPKLGGRTGWRLVSHNVA